MDRTGVRLATYYFQSRTLTARLILNPTRQNVPTNNRIVLSPVTALCA
jgi:hypothetical protein